MIGKSAIAVRRPRLASAALAVAIGGALIPTPAVPLTGTSAAAAAGPDAGAGAAEQLTFQAVLRVTDADADRPALPDRRRADDMTTV